MVTHLLDENYSNETFDLNYVFLRKIEKGQTIKEKKFVNGKGRYWSEAFIINSGIYIVCNDWYERHRYKFVKWLELMNSKIMKK